MLHARWDEKTLQTCLFHSVLEESRKWQTCVCCCRSVSFIALGSRNRWDARIFNSSTGSTVMSTPTFQKVTKYIVVVCFKHVVLWLSRVRFWNLVYWSDCWLKMRASHRFQLHNAIHETRLQQHKHVCHFLDSSRTLDQPMSNACDTVQETRASSSCCMPLRSITWWVDVTQHIGTIQTTNKL